MIKAIFSFVFGVVMSVMLAAQAPQAFNYQAVARDNGGVVLAAGTLVDIRFTIHDLTAGGAVLYQEEHTSVAINQFGLFVAAVGNGTVLHGTFNAVGWATPKFLQVEFKLHAASAYSDMGTTQLLSVPYSLVAETALTSSQWKDSAANIYNGNKGYVGIGTAVPWSELDVRGTDSGSIFGYRMANFTEGGGPPASGSQHEVLQINSENIMGAFIRSQRAVGMYVSSDSSAALQAFSATGPAGLFYAMNNSGTIPPALVVTSGYVGIGTSTPRYMMDVVDDQPVIHLRSQNYTTQSNSSILFQTHDSSAYLNMGLFDTRAQGNFGASQLSKKHIAFLDAYSNMVINAGDTLNLSTSANSTALTINSVGVGIGTYASKFEGLEVNGGINIGNTTHHNAGTIRYDNVSNIFQGYNGTSWVTFGSGGGGSQNLSYDNQTHLLSISGGAGADLSSLSETLSYNSGTGVLSLSNGSQVTLPSGTNLWSANGNNITNSNSGVVNIGSNTSQTSSLSVYSLQNIALTVLDTTSYAYGIKANATGQDGATGINGGSNSTYNGVGVIGTSGCSTCIGVEGTSASGFGGYFSSVSSVALATGSGMVGINTISPQYLFDVNGKGKFRDTLFTSAIKATSLAIGNYHLPTTDGTNGYVLATNGAGAVGWVQQASGGGGAWALTGNTGTDATLNFIGTTDIKDLVFKTNSIEGLRLTAGGALLATGTASGVTPVSGAGNRMMWIPAKGAFRAGYATGTEWDDANVGNYSVGVGYGATATGSNTLCIGPSAAIADASGTFGSANASNAMNTYTFGYNNTAGTTGAFGIGSYNTVYGGTAFAFGDNNFARATNSVSVGILCDARAQNSVAMGMSAVAYANNAFAIGNSAYAVGTNSFAIGSNISAPAGFEMALGQYASNYTPASSTGWDPADRLFTVGGGTAYNTPYDALVILKNGHTGLGTATPNHLLELATADAAMPGGGSWIATSDIRLKKDVTPYIDGLAQLLKIHPVKYHYNQASGYDTKPEYIGVIAQELQKVAPYMVGTYNKSGTEYLDVNNSAMTYTLINAIKEQQQMIEEQKQEIEALKQQNAASKADMQQLKLRFEQLPSFKKQSQ